MRITECIGWITDKLVYVLRCAMHMHYRMSYGVVQNVIMEFSYTM